MSEDKSNLRVSEELYFVKRNAELIMQLASSILPEHHIAAQMDAEIEQEREREHQHMHHDQRASP